jgi:PilZ domain
MADDGKFKERRSVQRTAVKRSAKIIVPRRSPVIHCTVQNITSGGACLKLANTYGIPENFDLTFECGRTRRACRVAWRTADKLGVAFQGEEMPVETESAAPVGEAASPLASAQMPLVAGQPQRLAESGIAANDNVSPLRAQKRIPAKPFGGESKS